MSAFSTSSTSSPSRSKLADRSNEPLGLHVVHDPPTERAVDIIFVHGLGGTSRLSWSWNRDLSLFWPQEWLPLEPGLQDARMLTFGYNAHFMSQAKDIFNISDFAKDLLLQMKFANDENVKSLNIGHVPIIFVAHSMGGLVVKKVCVNFASPINPFDSSRWTRRTFLGPKTLNFSNCLTPSAASFS